MCYNRNSKIGGQKDKMINRDWEKFGDDIRRTVQNAIDSQDFGKLNQTITNTINDAVDNITSSIRNVQGNQENRKFGMYQKGHPYQAQTRQSPSYQKKLPKLFRKMSSVSTGGALMTVAGAVLGGVGLILFIPLLFSSLLRGCGILEIMMMAIFLILSAGGCVLYGCGSGIRGRGRRFRTYIQILGQREYCNVRELADKSKKKVKYVIKDLEYMLSKKWFLQGHLDERKTCLIVSDRMYQQYLEIEADRKENELEELRRDTREEAVRTGKKAGGKTAEQSRDGGTQTAGRSDLPAEVQRVIGEGDAYIRKIHACNDAIPGDEISAKISRMEMLVDKIFDRVEQDPESVDDIRKMMDYYLPTTVKLLEAYRELSAQPVDGENIRSSKREIEATLDTLNVAFERLLDSMFQETAWDVSSDISVLQTMLAQEGLVDDGLKIGGQDRK